MIDISACEARAAEAYQQRQMWMTAIDRRLGADALSPAVRDRTVSDADHLRRYQCEGYRLGARAVVTDPIAVGTAAGSVAEPVAIRPLDADQHGGLCVAQVELSDRRYAVLRPWPSDGYRTLAAAAEVLDHVFVVPRHVEFSAYGRAWMAIEWIQARTSLTRTEQQQCYFGYGALAATAWLLGVTDLHAENIVVAGVPHVVDAEFVLDPLPVDSALSLTGLTHPLERDRPVHSPIDGPACIRRRGDLTVEATGHATRAPGRELSSHRPTDYRGRPTAPSDHERDLAAGYVWAWNRLTVAGPEVFEQLSCRARHLFRPTRLYQAYLDLLDTPSVATRSQRALGYLTDLSQRAAEDGWDSDPVATMEAQDLSVGDVPWFGWHKDLGLTRARRYTTTPLQTPVCFDDRVGLLKARFASGARDRLVAELRTAVRHRTRGNL